MSDESKPLSVAQIHSVYRDGLSGGGNASATMPVYRKATFSTREATHPGSPPPRPPASSKLKRR